MQILHRSLYDLIRNEEEMEMERSEVHSSWITFEIGEKLSKNKLEGSEANSQQLPLVIKKEIIKKLVWRTQRPMFGRFL